MTPNGAVGQLVAGVACDIIRDDQAGQRSYLLFDGSFLAHLLGAPKTLRQSSDHSDADSSRGGVVGYRSHVRRCPFHANERSSEMKAYLSVDIEGWPERPRGRSVRREPDYEFRTG